MFSKEIGIDLGTANTSVYLKGKGIIIRESTVVAVNSHTNQAKYIGEEAKKMIGRTPGSIVPVCPLKDGVIADFDVAAILLQELMRNALRSRNAHAKVVICIPSSITHVERRAVRDAAIQAGAKPVQIVEAPMAAAIGAGLPTLKPIGSMIVDIGSGTTEIAVISLGGIVVSKSIRCAGEAMDAAIISSMRKKYSLLIGENTAEKLKISLGTAAPVGQELLQIITGRQATDGMPKDVSVSTQEMREFLSEPLSRIVDAIKQVLEETPPELASDIMDNGIVISGGGACLPGIDRLISDETHVPVRIAEFPMDCVVEGTGRILNYPERYRDAIQDEADYEL